MTSRGAGQRTAELYRLVGSLCAALRRIASCGGRVLGSARLSPLRNAWLLVIFLCVTPCRARIQSSSPACRLSIRKCVEDYEYFRDGDVVVGGVLRMNCALNAYQENGFILSMVCLEPLPPFYKNLLTFIFAIEEVNENPDILPNITLGYHVFDSCASEQKAVRSVLQILSGPGKTVPNYSCTERGKVAGFIGDQISDTTIPMAQILGVYGYAQISNGATHSSLSDRRMYPTFFRTIQNDNVNLFILSKLLKYFGWDWVGILASDDESGDQESRALAKYMKDDGVCAEYIIKIHYFQNVDQTSEYTSRTVQRSTSQVIVFCGSFSKAFIHIIGGIRHVFVDKTVILGTVWASNKFLLNTMADIFNGSLTLSMYFGDYVPKLSLFLERFHPTLYPDDKILRDLWITYFKCKSADNKKAQLYELLYGLSLRECTGRERLNQMISLTENEDVSPVYNALLAMANAMNDMHMSWKRNSVGDKVINYKHQLHHYLRNLKADNRTRGRPYFDEHGGYVTLHAVRNWVKTKGALHINLVGVFDPRIPEDQKLLVRPERITWKNAANRIPRSRCSQNCLPGYRKAQKPGIHSCCYDCVLCSEGETSNTTDSEICIKCPQSEWPSEKKDRCLPKLEEFLSYDDVFAIFFMSVLLLFCLLTVAVAVIFVLHQDTPIVKANNRNLSFLLLVSIMLSFLCVFLFLGRPVDITCVLRQTAFGVIFSVAVSSVLAKTIMVCIAFKATKPGSSWRKWLGVKLSSSVAFFCSSVQVIIIIFWLSISPPFQELDMHSYQGIIIVQCNEGSVIAFYCVLGYMGLLAAVSFIIAFLARTLPDSFNEAKYITFSMLVFCSVWIAMIPAYLSTKGKYMVAVEIFAILASSAGLLGCIFFPKCYVALFRPELNTKLYLLKAHSR